MLTIDSPEVPPVRYGRIGDRDAVLQVTSLGFPRFKLRKDTGGRYRDTAHVAGSAAVLSNRRSGTLEIAVPAPPGHAPREGTSTEPWRSPWEGMSGAAVFAGDRLVAVVSEHHPAEGTGRLTALRVDGFPAELRTLLNVPSDLPDVVPPSLGALTQATYLAQARDIAPEHLWERDDDLNGLVDFCAGADRYLWIQGRPWAGKSALTSWFVIHPPAGVRIASFFVTSRMSGYADADAFLQAMIEQLAVIAGRSGDLLGTRVARRGLFLELLDAAARRCREHGERLLLVVDGLDEDQGSEPSIAYLLPKRPPDGVRVLVSSRRHPDLPTDVPGDHPLRHCVRRHLEATPYAEHIESDAKNELRALLRRAPMVEVLGFIVACGGGLTLGDLAELTGLETYELGDRLGSAFGRSLSKYTREADTVYLFAHETLGVQAEEALGPRTVTSYRERLHRWADGYRERGWPDDTPNYLFQPYGRLLIAEADLPRLSTLGVDRTRHDQMLQRTGSELASLTELAAAHELLARTPGPDLAVALRLAEERERITERGSVPPDLPALFARLGQIAKAEALAAVTKNSTAYARLAVALADSAPDQACSALDAAFSAARTQWLPLASDQFEALIDLVLPCSLLRPHAVPALIVEISSLIESLYGIEDYAKHQLAGALAHADRADKAEHVIATMTSSEYKAMALSALVEILTRVDEPRARRLLDTAESLSRQRSLDSFHVCAALARAAAGLDLNRARAAAHRAREAARPSKHLIPALVQTFVVVGWLDLVPQLVPDMPVELIRGSTDLAPSEDDLPLLEALGDALTDVGELDHATRLALMITHRGRRISLLVKVATKLAEADPVRASELAAIALRSAQSAPGGVHQAYTLAALAEALGTVDARGAARAAAALELQEPWPGGQAARAHAAAGDLERTMECLAELTSFLRPRAAREVVAAALGDGRIADAARLASVAEGHSAQSQLPAALAALGESLGGHRTSPADVTDLALGMDADFHGIDAIRIRTAVLQAIADQGLLRQPTAPRRGLPWPDQGGERIWWHEPAPALGAIAGALAGQDPQAARRCVDLALTLLPTGDEMLRAEAFSALASGLATIDPERSRDLARQSLDTLHAADSPGRFWFIESCAVALARTGLFAEAEQTVRTIDDEMEQAEALAYIAELIADRDRDRAVRITLEILGGDHWWRTFRTLRILDPDALRTLFDTLVQ